MQMGCEHYERKVKFLAPCCNKVYSCRFCHDDQEKHFINRKGIITIICLYCNYPQEVRHTCLKCNQKMAEYFCSICTLYDDNGFSKGTAHCKKCDSCRCYSSYKDKYYHCKNCTICRRIDTKYTHRCFRIREEDECSLCFKRMRNSKDTFVTPPCAHFMHQKCYDVLTDKKCPKCDKKMV